MPFSRWIDAHQVGIFIFDKEHKLLIETMNDLYEGMLSGSPGVILDNVLDELVAYGERHMQREEAAFAETGYPQATWHIGQHNDFRKRILDLREKAQTQNDKIVALETLTYLKDWLVRHIEKADMDFAEFLKDRIPPGTAPHFENPPRR